MRERWDEDEAEGVAGLFSEIFLRCPGDQCRQQRTKGSGMMSDLSSRNR